METRQLYFAYGMNTNKEQMARRCPNAKPLGSTYITGWRFVFRGVGDVVYTGDPSDRLYGAIWEITDECERALDSLEGYPTFYDKIYIDNTNDDVYPGLWQQHGENLNHDEIMIYQMTRQNARSIHDPSQHYWEMLWEGYEQFGMPHSQMKEGLPQTSHYKGVTEIRKQRRYANKRAAMWI